MELPWGWNFTFFSFITFPLFSRSISISISRFGLECFFCCWSRVDLCWRFIVDSSTQWARDQTHSANLCMLTLVFLSLLFGFFWPNVNIKIYIFISTHRAYTQCVRSFEVRSEYEMKSLLHLHISLWLPKLRKGRRKQENAIKERWCERRAAKLHRVWRGKRYFFMVTQFRNLNLIESFN